MSRILVLVRMALTVLYCITAFGLYIFSRCPDIEDLNYDLVAVV